MSRVSYHKPIAALLSSLLLLCLTFCPVTASATEAQFASDKTMMADDLSHMPMISDCIPCALCYLASAPEAPNGFDEKYAVTATYLWIAPIRLVAYAAHIHTGGDYSRLPVRIVYCRWLN